MGIKVVTPPAVEPVSLSEAKAHLRVDGSDEDAVITRLIGVAREECEHILGRSVAPQTLMVLLDKFPCGAIVLPRGPVVAIDLVEYVDTAGATQTIAGANYTVDDAQIDGWLLPAYDYEWPATREQANAVRVTYQTGWASCPKVIQQWILLRVGTLYAWREADAERPAMPSGFAERLLDRYRVLAP